MKINTSITQLIGNTPLLELKRYSEKHNLKAKIIAKLEYLNPAGSVKDRVALAMVEDAEAKGLLKPGATIFEPTSGNTGIGLALVAAAKGYKLVLTMPETMSIERRKLVKAYGAEVVLTDGKAGMTGAIEKAEELHRQTPGSIIAGQFVNPANPICHKNSTGPEIWADTDGTVDIFVAGVGTGGTLSGVAEYLKEQNPAIKVYAVEPYSIYFNDSPTQSISYEVVNSLEKVVHNHDMLSLEKTKALNEVKDFLGNVPYLAMCKMDGLTCSLKYYDGILVSAETRGNGLIGENILH
ncbi:MAG: pyridoxal-phosphate dependent enzyme, partial [Spirochaetales bacterium]|nr:pyridoxal-phosphate dependent enzyme [Spirochaetales bacterium]